MSGQRAAELAQDARDSELRDGDAKHREFAMNPRRAPQRIGTYHLFN